MRFTSILYKVNYHRHFQRIWKRQGKMEIKEYVMPPELQAVEIKDAKEILEEIKLFQQPKKTSKFGERPYPLPPSVFTAEMPFYKMHNDTKVTEGENQIMALTKTIPYEGLPNQINSLIGTDSLPNQDEIVQTNILQALVWDAMQDKLPRKKDPEKRMWIFKREYGIPQEKKVLNLLEKLSCLCDSATGKYSKCFQRNKLQDVFCETAIDRRLVGVLESPYKPKVTFQDGSNVAFQMECDIMLKTKEPLARFATSDEVKETENLVVPDIFPIKPTLDLDKCEENPIKNPPILYNPSFGHIHTLFMAQKTYDPWSPNQLLAKAIAMCFAFSATEARWKYGDNVGLLPEPVNIQCMYTDAKSANFLAYQLNTLELSHNEGIKNQVWIDEPADFYSNVTDVDFVSDYNPSLFSKMLALHIHGLRTRS